MLERAEGNCLECPNSPHSDEVWLAYLARLQAAKPTQPDETIDFPPGLLSSLGYEED
jgi:hypothetical protein